MIMVVVLECRAPQAARGMSSSRPGERARRMAVRAGACVTGSMWPAPGTLRAKARGAARTSASETRSVAAGLVVPVMSRHKEPAEGRKAHLLGEHRLEVALHLVRFEREQLLAHGREPGPGASAVPVVDELRHREHPVLVGSGGCEGAPDRANALQRRASAW